MLAAGLTDPSHRVRCRLNNLKVLSDVTFNGDTKYVQKDVLLSILSYSFSACCRSGLFNKIRRLTCIRCNQTKNICSISLDRIFKENKLKLNSCRSCYRVFPKEPRLTGSMLTRMHTHAHACARMHARTHNSSVGARFNVSPFIQVSQEFSVELPGDSVVPPFVPSFGTEPLPPTRYHRNERLQNQVVYMPQMTLFTITLDYCNSLFQNVSFNIQCLFL